MVVKFEAGKEYKTRDGTRVRVYATNHAGEFPICGAVYCTNGSLYGWVGDSWDKNGKYYKGGVCNSCWDIMPPEVMINYRITESGTINFCSREQANFQITFVDGEAVKMELLK